MPLLDYQWEYTNGPRTVLLGAGTIYDIERVKGLFDMDIRDGDRPFTRDHGDLPGEHLLSPKEIEIDFEVRGDVTLQTYWDAVYEAQYVFTTRQFPGDLDRLKFKVPGLDEGFIRARPIQRLFERHWSTEYGLAPFTARLKAADPRIYRPIAAMNTASGSSFSVTNEGNANAYPKITFTSGTAILTNNTTGVTLELDGAPGGTVVDLDRWIRGVNALIVYNGATSHYDKWIQPRLPFSLGSGSNSLSVSSGSVTVEWYDTTI